MPTSREPPDFPASQLFLRRLAFSLVRDAERAEDLVQDTWAAWAEHGSSEIAAPRAWLARVLRNRAFNLKRSERRHGRPESLAGRPDPSAPETDGTLEAQTQLLEALRGLEEPYRSTLVQRYYHDLAPSAIAARSGAPLETVKSRLARGLARLRSELDRRYHGDRRAWCHWLTGLGPGAAPVLPAARPASGGAGPGAEPRLWAPTLAAGARGIEAVVGGGALGKGFLLAGLGLSLLGWVLWRGERGPVELSPVTVEEVAMRGLSELHEPAREPLPAPREKEPPARKTVPAPRPETPPPRAFVPAAPFDWPQLAGTPTHDSFGFLGPRKDLILHPRVRFELPGLAGQPTLRGTELYSGGRTLYRVDLTTDAVHPAGREVLERIRHSIGRYRGSEELEQDLARAWADRIASQGLTKEAWVAGAPVLTGELVIARMIGDGSVSAFDRDLAAERWRWEATDPWPCPLSGCLVGDLYLAAHRREVVALVAASGWVEWTFEADEHDEVNLVPASDGELVYFATARGRVYALELATGKVRWRREAEASFGWSAPVVLADQVIFTGVLVTQGGLAKIEAFQSYDGRELWGSPLPWSMRTPPSPGTGPGVALCTQEGWLGAWALETRQLTNGQLGSKSLQGTPTWIGDTLVTIEEKSVTARERQTMDLLWSAPLRALDFVHAGDRIYVVTERGLVCLEDDPEEGPVPPGFVLGKRSSQGRKGARPALPKLLGYAAED